MHQTKSITVSPGRHVAWKALLPFKEGLKGRIHAEERLDTLFSSENLDARERGFATYLVYGVLRHWFVLNHLIEAASDYSLPKLDKRLVLLLRLGLFQVLWMTHVPDYAALSQTLAQAEALGVSKKGRGVLSAILHRASRGELKPPPVSPETVFPQWWAKRLVERVGEEQAQALAEVQLEIPGLSLRVNALKTTPEAFCKALEAAEKSFEVDGEMGDLIRLPEGAGSVSEIAGFKEGHVVVQDASSMAVAITLDPQPGESILEIGAAPGSKTAHMAALMNNQGQILATDISASRLTRLLEAMTRLGITMVTTNACDGKIVDSLGQTFDRVLIDAPCSGSGTTAKHPEIVLSLKEGDFERFATTQLALLKAAWEVLKPGGVLVYSTCSIDPVENQGVLQAFMSHAPQAQIQSAQTRWPSPRQDGFFIARLLKP